MSRSTDKLAFALASPEPVSRRHFRSVFDHLYVTDAVPAGDRLDDIDRHRRATESNLDALSICEIVFGERQTVESCAPHLGLLPHAGFPAAVLFGARTPALLRIIVDSVRRRRQLAVLTMTGQPASPLLPQRVRLQARDLEALRSIADEARIPLIEPAVSWRLLLHSFSVADYTATRAWSTGDSALNWLQQDFDLETLSFRGGTAGASLRLTRYRHPSRPDLSRYRLTDGDTWADVEPSWGRYVLLSRASRPVLEYDGRMGVLLIPLYCPLPKLLTRGLVACSGFAPQEVAAAGQPAQRAFVRVPASHAEVVASKLGQVLVRTTVTAPLKEAYD